jgi:hypothetical protein
MSPAVHVNERKNLHVIVSVDDDHLERLDAVVDGLRSAGMTVEATLPSLGAVAGCVSQMHLGDIRSVEGVEAVEASREVALAPPDSPVQ